MLKYLIEIALHSSHKEPTTTVANAINPIVIMATNLETIANFTVHLRFSSEATCLKPILSVDSLSIQGNALHQGGSYQKGPWG